MNKTIVPDMARSATDACTDYLRNAILNGEFAEDSPVIIDRIAQVLNVSHTPIREAIRRLEAEGFVSFRPRRGAVVRKVSLAEFEELVEIRKALEPILITAALENIDAAGLANAKAAFSGWTAQTDPTETLRAQWAFYESLYVAAGKPVVLSTARANWNHIHRYHRIAWDHAREVRSQDIEMMGEMFEHFKINNRPETLKALDQTINWGRDLVRDTLT